ncbi:Wiskott-Aldrich syndrome protein-like isoform X1 [Oopsacas minuta]|uniref:Wiskott-Aldrich syndrome protein-like isoform X1 n=1 Tax=Oopsacas minuta TaxID=111878 RepID=A0AAV7KH11_9METZ|nr:Wiskott-Aldrich syndrome protein-like isoform X1 [Oopsacas minuta]
MRKNMNNSMVKNDPSHVLLKTENKKIKDILGENRISICTTYAQIYVTSKSEQDWQIVGTGALCLTHDFQLNTFILVLIDADRIIWECELTNYADYMWVSRKFHLLNVDQLMGINFICDFEAQYFSAKMVEITSYIKIASLEYVTILNTTNHKKHRYFMKPKTNKANTAPHLNKQNTKDFSIKYGISHFNKYFKRIIKQNNSYQRIENSTSLSMPPSPTFNNRCNSLGSSRNSSVSSMGEEEHYQTLKQVKSSMINSMYPCHAY